MRTHASFHPLTLAHAFEQFLEASSFARRTRESYAEDLAPLLAEVGQQPGRLRHHATEHALDEITVAREDARERVRELVRRVVDLDAVDDLRAVRPKPMIWAPGSIQPQSVLPGSGPV